MGRSNDVRFLPNSGLFEGICVRVMVLWALLFTPALMSFLCVHPCSITPLGLISFHMFSLKVISHPLLSPHTMSLQGGVLGLTGASVPKGDLRFEKLRK